MLTMPSSPMATNTSGLSTQPCGIPSAPYLGGSAARSAAGYPTASTSPPSAEAPWRNFRRLTLAITNAVSDDAGFTAISFGQIEGRVHADRSFLTGRLLDGGTDASIRSAAADVASHGGIDIGVGRLGFLLEERGRGHDLPSLAVAALRDAHVDPRRLHGFADLVRADRLDGDDLLVRERGNRGHACASRLTVDMHRAGTAQRHAAAELRAGETDLVAQHPQ